MRRRDVSRSFLAILGALAVSAALAGEQRIAQQSNDAALFPIVSFHRTDMTLSGCGVYIGRGLVLTCAHGYSASIQQVTVCTDGLGCQQAKLIAIDHRLDVALLAVPYVPGTRFMIASDQDPQPGDQVLIAGYGMSRQFRWISGVASNRASPTRGGQPGEWYFIRARTEEGDSGAAVMNARGQLAGINVAGDGRDAVGVSIVAIRQVFSQYVPAWQKVDAGLPPLGADVNDLPLPGPADELPAGSSAQPAPIPPVSTPVQQPEPSEGASTPDEAGSPVTGSAAPENDRAAESGGGIVAMVRDRIEGLAGRRVAGLIAPLIVAVGGAVGISFPPALVGIASWWLGRKITRFVGGKLRERAKAKLSSTAEQAAAPSPDPSQPVAVSSPAVECRFNAKILDDYRSRITELERQLATAKASDSAGAEQLKAEIAAIKGQLAACEQRRDELAVQLREAESSRQKEYVVAEQDLYRKASDMAADALHKKDPTRWDGFIASWRSMVDQYHSSLKEETRARYSPVHQ